MIISDSLIERIRRSSDTIALQADEISASVPLLDVARSFVDGWEWMEIGQIEIFRSYKGGGVFVPNPNGAARANIQVNLSPDEDKDMSGVGVFSHELFHATFHKSPLHSCSSKQRLLDEKWGDGFCDAFRAVHEPVPTSWNGFYELAGLSNDELRDKASSDRYWAAAHLILRRFGRTNEELLQRWKHLCQRARTEPDGVMNRELGLS